jgi:hypothetical protein
MDSAEPLLSPGGPRLSAAIAGEINEGCRSKSISLNSLSVLIGKGRTYLANLFARNGVPPMEAMLRIATVLDLDKTRLMDMYISFAPQDSPALLNSLRTQVEEAFEAYIRSDWRKSHTGSVKSESYTVFIGRRFGECYISDNMMNGAAITRGSKVLYDVEDKAVKSGMVYCFSFAGETRKLVREVYESGSDYILAAVNIHSDKKIQVLPKENVNILGRALCVISLLNLDEGEG